MLLVELMTALAVALLLTAIFAVGLRSRGLWRNWLIFFGLVSLAAWAGGVWLPPIGPAVVGVYWMPFLFVGLVVALLWAMTSRSHATTRERPPRAKAEERVDTTFSVFVWI